MEYIHGTEDFKLDKPSAVTLGKFDGVHLGHQKLISIVREKADELGLLSVMLHLTEYRLAYVRRRISIFYLRIRREEIFVRIMDLMLKLNIRSRQSL